MMHEKNRQEANLIFMKNLLGLEQEHQLFCGDDDLLQPLALGRMASNDSSSKDSFYRSVCQALLESDDIQLPPFFKSVDTFLSFSSTGQGVNTNNDDDARDTTAAEYVLPQCPSVSPVPRPTLNDDTSKDRLVPCCVTVPAKQVLVPSVSLDMRCRYESIGTIDVDLAVFEQDLKAMEEVDHPVTSSVPAPVATFRKVNKRKSVTENQYITDGVNPHDVLFGQGGQSNKNKGNVRYRAIVERIRPIYATASMAEKTTIAQGVVKEIAGKGGRFLIKDKNSHQLYLADDRAARIKVAQALREKYITPEERAAKRARYSKNNRQ